MGFFDVIKNSMDRQIKSTEQTIQKEIKRVDEFEKRNSGSNHKSEDYRNKLNDKLDQINDYKSSHE